MLSREENELLCRIGAGTPMGKLMRRYWMPTLMSSELPAGGDPKRVRLLGENLVAFRDRAGNVGLLDENCPHRGASLALARVEECGLRCLYHGWLIGADGRVLEAPPEPEEHGFKDRVRAPGYPVQESGGMIWAYLGPPEHQPPLPNFPFTQLPLENVLTMKVKVKCNWAQVIEGVIDSAHTNYLHQDVVRPTSAALGASRDIGVTIERPSNDGQPRIEARNTKYGFRYAAIRKPNVDADKNKYIRVTAWIAPFYSMFPGAQGWEFLQGMVPIDDENTIFHYWRYRLDRPVTDQEREFVRTQSGFRLGPDVDPETWELHRNPANNWLQNRAAMTAGTSWTGIDGANLQDIAVEESMGAIYDRTKEHLGTSDVAVIRMRRLLIDSARGLEQGGTPVGMGGMADLAALHVDEAVMPLDQPWEPISAHGALTGSEA
jgi:phthalate 4,5-dioxygenase oxygenase subunit